MNLTKAAKHLGVENFANRPINKERREYAWNALVLNTVISLCSIWSALPVNASSPGNYQFPLCTIRTVQECNMRALHPPLRDYISRSPTECSMYSRETWKFSWLRSNHWCGNYKPSGGPSALEYVSAPLEYLTLHHSKFHLLLPYVFHLSEIHVT